jgi:hypothetical protein
MSAVATIAVAVVFTQMGCGQGGDYSILQNNPMHRKISHIFQ